jgi:threonine dehydratase
MTDSPKLGGARNVRPSGFIADGAAVKQVGEHTFALYNKVDEMIVDNDATARRLKMYRKIRA